MSRANLLALFVIGLVVTVFVASLQNSPGYMDADYYMAGGLRLVQGYGFSEIIIWNYLDDPQGLPHPSHSYWMPLASVISALGMWLTGQHDFYSARLPFIFLAGLIPPVTSLLAYRLTERRELALLSGLLAAFPTYQVSYLATTDNFVLYRLLGALFFLFLSRLSYKSAFLLGFIAGLMNLSRTDGVLWLGLSLLAVVLHLFSLYKLDFVHWRRPIWLLSFCVFAGFLLVTAPWFARNLGEFGTFMAPGGSRAMLLIKYEDTYIFPASQITLERWLNSGWQEIFGARFKALWLNLGTSFIVFWGIFLGPFVVLAAWKMRKDLRVQLGALGFLALFFVMTLVFPFAGPRGSFLHAGVAFMPLSWALAPLGLEDVIAAARRRNWFTPQAQRVFRVILFAATLALTLPLINIRVANSDWDLSYQTFLQIEKQLKETGAVSTDVVMVTNPPGYFLASGRPSIASPDADLDNVVLAARTYQARYLVLERTSIPERLVPFLEQRESSPHLKLVFADLHEIAVYEFVGTD